MKVITTPGSIYIRAFAWYTVFTLPALIIPPMFVTSFIYAFEYGLIALALFMLFFYLLSFCKTRATLFYGRLHIAVPLAVIPAFQTIEWTGRESDVWNSGIFLCFPLAAVISGWLGVYNCRKKIFKYILTQNYVYTA